MTVPEIARALLQSEAAIGQRITRAKNKVRHANIPLRVPPAELLTERTPHMLACIYSVFTEGYWSTGGEARHGDRPPLPPPPPDCEDVIEISSRPARSRRGRTRLSLEARRLQIADAAVELVLDHGPNAVTMKAVAQAAGVSEALVYRYFSSVIELLVFLARREQVLMASIQAARTQSRRLHA